MTPDHRLVTINQKAYPHHPKIVPDHHKKPNTINWWLVDTNMIQPHNGYHKQKWQLCKQAASAQGNWAPAV